MSEMDGGRAQDMLPTIYAVFSVNSIYYGPLLLELIYDGVDDKVVSLGEGLRVTELKEAHLARVVSPHKLLLRGDRHRPSKLVVSVAGPDDAPYGSAGVTDSGWFFYPMITGFANVSLVVPKCTRAVVKVLFPKSTHFLPRRSHITVGGQVMRVLGANVSYPDVTEICTLTVEPRPDDALAHLELEYRESAMALLVTLVVPFMVNVIVPVMCLGQKAETVRIPAAVAIIPLFFNLWNWSNILRAAPTPANTITTLMATLVAFNFVFVFLWMFNVTGWLQAGAAVAYLLTSASVVWSVWQFAQRHRPAEATPLGWVQARMRTLWSKMQPGARPQGQ